MTKWQSDNGVNRIFDKHVFVAPTKNDIYDIYIYIYIISDIIPDHRKVSNIRRTKSQNLNVSRLNL